MIYNRRTVLEVAKQIDDPRLVLGVAEVSGGTVRESSDALKAGAAALAKAICAVQWEIPEDKRRAVRQLLKLGGFSPSGRNRPAHEFLVRDLKDRGSFNFINNVVDVNNVVSLESLLPISVFDVDKLDGPLSVRVGVPEESYVFNPAGQVLDVKRCIVCCRGAAPGEPVGSPVKDSMATKIFEGAGRFLGVIYGTTDGWSTSELEAHAQRFAELLARETGGEIVSARLV